MKNAFAHLFGLLLSVCLALYGTVGMAKAGTGTGFAIEICANGVVATVLIGADGSPIEPAQDCPDCVACCQATGDLHAAPAGADFSLALLVTQLRSIAVQDPVLNKRNIHPAPRGPPAVQISMSTMLKLIVTEQSVTNTKTRAQGRPLVKDAAA